MADAPVDQSGWLEIAIDAAPEMQDALGAFFFDLGCTGLVSEDFGCHTIKAYLPFGEDPEILHHRISMYLNELSAIHSNLPVPEFQLRRIENQDWHTSWRKFFKPVRVSQRLLVLPAWETAPLKKQGQHVIRIDPGPAFGTGQHSTTKMCLRAMEAFSDVECKTMLDVGTGSGILAIYAAKLGFSGVEAIDTDSEAVRWAKENMALNDATNAIALSTKGIETFQQAFHLVCANLILGTLLELMPQLCRVVKPDGHLVISGILREQEPIMAAALPHGVLSRVDTLYDEEWACMVLRKEGESHSPQAFSV